MPSGRNRIPTKLKILKGTLEKSRVVSNEFTPNTVNELQPRYLSDPYQLEEWQIITSELAAAGLLTNMDISLIEAYCVEAAKYRTAIEHLDAEGMIKVGKMGDYINPWHMISERSFDRMYKMGVVFGLSPSARAKIPTNKEKGNKLSEALNAKIG
jgi:P27 family predicted phage terminase small subunit